MFEEYIKKLSGCDIVSQEKFATTEVMDASFNYSTKLIPEIKKFLVSRDIDVKNIVVISALFSDIKRQQTKMETISMLYIVKDVMGIQTALLLSGCSLQENS